MKTIDNEYPNKLKDIKLVLMEPYKGANNKHLIKCLICNFEFYATPKSKIQNFRKHAQEGCAKCVNKKQYKEERLIFLQKIKNNGFEILSDFDGNRNSNKKILIKNITCGHSFETRPKNIISRNINCPICNNEQKCERLKYYNKKRSEDFRKTASEWNIYKHNVYMATRRSYKEYQNIINPNKLPRGNAGQKDKYHLDHIVPIRYCFENKIPIDICSHYTNLQMKPWRDNIIQKDRLKTDQQIPAIFEKYIKTVDNNNSI